MRNTKFLSKLSVEKLESRAMLAGDVLAHVVDGTLFIHGDDLDNQVDITTSGKEVTVQGSQTTINGGVGPVNFSSIARIEVIGGGGDDTVSAFLWASVDSPDIVEELHINTNAGKDAVLVDWRTTADVVIDTGDGADVASVRGYAASGDRSLQLNTGDGADKVGLDLRFHTQGQITVDTGNGNDALTAFFAPDSGGSLSVLMGNGNDEVTLYTGIDEIDMDLAIDGGRGTDSLFANLANFIGDLDVRDFNP